MKKQSLWVTGLALLTISISSVALAGPMGGGMMGGGMGRGMMVNAESHAVLGQIHSRGQCRGFGHVLVQALVEPPPYLLKNVGEAFGLPWRGGHAA